MRKVLIVKVDVLRFDLLTGERWEGDTCSAFLIFPFTLGAIYQFLKNQLSENKKAAL
jgi:hypothetical protein